MAECTVTAQGISIYDPEEIKSPAALHPARLSKEGNTLV